MLVMDTQTSTSMQVTCLHAPASFPARQDFWNTIRIIHASINLLWMCIGDFNEFLYPWSNNRDGDELVKEKLDHVFCSLDWSLTYPSSTMFALPSIGSDHYPLVMNTHYQSYKLQAVSHKLTSWSRSRFSNARQSIQHLQQQLSVGSIQGPWSRWPQWSFLQAPLPQLSHLFFADDAVFFLKASISVVSRYGKYLGIPSDWGRSKREMFSWILSMRCLSSCFPCLS